MKAPGSFLPVQSLPFGLFTVQWESSPCGGEGGLTMALTRYHNPPVRLVGQSQFPPNLSPSYTVSSSSVSGVSFQFSLEEGKIRPALERW